jgi:hypothetical protein
MENLFKTSGCAHVHFVHLLLSLEFVSSSFPRLHQHVRLFIFVRLLLSHVLHIQAEEPSDSEHAGRESKTRASASGQARAHDAVERERQATCTRRTRHGDARLREGLGLQQLN